MGHTFEGRFDGRGRKVALVASRFNDFITRELVSGARDALLRHGTADDDIDLASSAVPAAIARARAAAHATETQLQGAGGTSAA